MDASVEAQASAPVVQTAAVAQQTAAGRQTARPAATTTRPATTASQSPKSPTDLPPISYICTMPGDEAVLEDKPGKCPNPKCGMELKPIRIATAYSCLNNTAFIQKNPGKCRTDGTDLVPIAASMFWVCSDAPDKHELEPGKCADGKDRIEKFEVRPHGDHNPRHGGQFFMADDAWHHLEGTYPSAGLFRVFFYDDWTKPLTPKGFTGRLAVVDAAGKELSTIPVKPGRISNTMEAQIPGATLPLAVKLRVTFKPGDKERLWDFQFPAYTKEPVKPATTTGGAAGAPAVAAARPPVAAQPPARGATPSGARGETPQGRGRPTAAQQPAPTAPSQPSPFMTNDPTPAPGTTAEILGPIIPQEDPIPATTREILAELTAKSDELATEIREGAPLGQLWVAALRTKNLALALVTDHLNELPSRQRVIAENAANQIVRAAWAIDNLGDLGDKDKIVSVHGIFAAATSDLKAAYATIQ